MVNILGKQFGLILAAIGGIAPVFFRLRRDVLEANRNRHDRNRFSVRAYRWFMGAACVSLALMLVMTLLVRQIGIDDGELEYWALGLAKFWPWIGYPSLTVTLVFALRGLHIAVKARRDRELLVIAISTSVFFAASGLLLLTNSSIATGACLVLLVVCPLVWIFASRSGYSHASRP